MVIKVSCKNLPDDPEIVSINVIALDNVLVVLENNLNKGFVISTKDCCVKVHWPTGRVIGQATNPENSSNVVVVCKLKGSVSWLKRHTVNGISLLAINLSS